MGGSEYQPPVGSEEPQPPDHSLPSYGEPTPETHRRLSREEEAELALTRTEFTRGTRTLITLLFLLTILSLPLLNLAARSRQAGHDLPSPGAEVLALLPSGAELQAAVAAGAPGTLLPTAEEIKKAEKNLERDSIVSQFLLPRVQAFLTGGLHAGNEQVYPGREGWLFYRPDVDHVTGQPFLDPNRLQARAQTLRLQPNPIPAIVAFRDQLQARGIELLLVPVPVKPSIEGVVLATGSRAGGEAVNNASTAEFRAALEQAGVRTLWLEDSVRFEAMRVKEHYLKTDTHWRPEWMQRSAESIAQIVTTMMRDGRDRDDKAHPQEGRGFTRVHKEVRALGDIALLLKLPANQVLYEMESVTIDQVQLGNALWHPAPESDVLLLGDSFSNIYSLAGMHWGESAGLAEQISFHLGQPIDGILRNSDGAFATREILSQELARGRDRLAGKKVVIWEFAQRELSFGDWKMLPMRLGTPPPRADFLSLQEPQELVVEATISEVSSVPRPGSVPYRDHILSVHLEEIAGLPAAAGRKVQARAYLWSMRNNHWTSAARLRPGDRVHLRLSAWPGADLSREQFNRSELLDPALQLEDAVWAELLEAK